MEGTREARPQQERAMVSEEVAPVLVARTLGAFDLVVIFVGIVLFIVNSASLQFAGPALFVYWGIAFLTFLITGGFVTAQLGRMFPEEGSIYVWTHKALGPFWGFFAGFVAWWPGPIVMVLAGILVATFAQQIATFADSSILTESWQVGLVVLAVIWFGAGISLLRMRLTQNYVNLQFVFYAAAIFVMGLGGLVWLWKGNPAANSFAGELFNPLSTEVLGETNLLGLGIPALFTAFSFCVLALLGIEVPLNMGVEVKSEDAIRKYLLWGSVFVMVAYLWTSFGNMAVVPLADNNATTGGAQTVGIAIGEGVGIVVALILMWFFLTSSAVYNYSFARLLFVSGLERRLPHQIGQVNRNKVPANAVILQTVIASVIAIVVFFVIGQAAGSDPNKPYLALLAGVTIVWCISTGLLFLDIFFAKRANPQKFEAARRVPEGFLYLCGAIGTLANAAAVLFVFVGQWSSDLFPTLREWNTWMIVITAVSVITGVAIYAISEVTRRGTRAEAIEEGTAASTPGGGGAAE
ncbi:MAG: APC family permease [Actinomycetota bacterium]